jgi:hypothetical protein
MESEHEQSLILEEADSFHSEFEALAAFPNVQNLTTCSCRGYCLCERGRNFCPCKSVGNHCSTACRDGNTYSSCMNSRRVHKSNSDDSVSLLLYFFIQNLVHLSPCFCKQ